MMTNSDFINAYKSDTKIISDYYKYKDQYGKLQDVIGIINPLKIDNRQLMAPTDSQSVFPHCAAYSAATIIESIYWKMTGKLKQLDSHQIYSLAKLLDGAINIDGTYLEYAMESVIRLCKADPEFKFLENARIKTFFNDKTNNTIELTKQLLHKYDFLQVGFNIDEGWYDCNQMNYILKARGNNLGGHAVDLCGYDSDGFYILNQWGSGVNGQKGWGAKGYAIIPYQLFLQQFIYGVYLTSLSFY